MNEIEVREQSIRDVLIWLDARMNAEELDMAAEHFGVDVQWRTS